ncbi:hypothetical protein [uncultured Gimesia sp.]|uniref:hypothetical protein n=1 Tax=uncultured Gimesia sp. TaxID=1678688 RepID=UPI00262A25E0|nr:hypothetical protein [uncultured Gimesia sp.]
MSQAASDSSQSQPASADLKLIATSQKGILVCILIYLGAVAGQSLVPVEMFLFFGLALLILIIVATAFVFLLATKLYGVGVGIFLGVLTMIPLVGLLVLLIVNGKATQTLKKNGVSVGLLGARGPIS